MKHLCFMLLLIFIVKYDYVKGCNNSKNPGSVYTDYGNGIYFFYNNTYLHITEAAGNLRCYWEDFQCYIECNSGNLTVNITGTYTISAVSQNVSIKYEKAKLVFKIGTQEATCNVTKCLSTLISPLINELSMSNDLHNLKKPTRMKQMCSRLFANDTIIRKVYIRAEKKYIDALISSVVNKTLVNYDMDAFNMTVYSMDMMQPTDQGLVQLSAPLQVSDDDLPVDVFLPTKPFIGQKIGIVTYPTDHVFTTGPNTVLKSKIVRIETVGQENKHLSERLVMNYTVNSSETLLIKENQTLSCLYYNVNAPDGQEWDDMGSFTNLEHFNSSNTVTCTYDHMTPFAVLLVDMNTTQITPHQWKILSIISYIGCSVSSLFSAVTIFVYAFMKKSNINNSIRIHVSLSVAYFLLNTSFLFIEWGASWHRDSVCVFIAVIIQYSLLSCFCWMAIEALHLYLLLLKVFNTYIKHYMVKLLLFGWGVPAVVVGGSLCVNASTSLYGTTNIKLFGTNDTTNFCWITDTRFLYGINLPFFSLTFLFNTTILLVVAQQICKHRQMSVKGTKHQINKDICTVLGLTVLLGLTWGLAFFTSGYTNYPVLYLFCICNTLQGLFLCVWFHSTIKKNRTSKEEITTRSDTTMVKTHESSFTQ